MPSPLELLATGDPNPPGPPPDDLLRSVKTEGRRRRGHRRRRNLAIALLGLGVLAVPAAALRPDGGKSDEISVAADGGGPAPDIAPIVDEAMSVPGLVPGDPPATLPDPATPVAVAPPVEPAPTTAPASPGPAAATSPSTSAAPPHPPTSTTAARVCRNSTDPACGPFRWDPAPSPNQPLVAEFTKAPLTAVAGTPVTFEVRWSDGDAKLTYERFSTDGTALNMACSEPARFGPWTPPAAAGGSGTLPYTTTFATPGEYLVTVSVGTGECSASPYYGDKTINTTITVTAPGPTG